MNRIPTSAVPALAAMIVVAFACGPAPSDGRGTPAEPLVASGSIPSADGVSIAYTATGAGSPALVFIHGGFADQSFWSEQVASLSDRYQVITLDLAGHGASGRDRTDWSIDAFGEDVRAVVDAVGPDSIVLVGNSLGGPVGLSAAKRLPGVVRGLIAVDTFQRVRRKWTREQMDAYIRTFRDDFDSACRNMVQQLLTERTDPALHASIESRMCTSDPAVAPRILEAFANYDLAAEFAAAGIPIRAILGEIIPLDLEEKRELHPDFDAVVMPGCGHYPMLERPEEFDRHLVSYVEDILSRRRAGGSSEACTGTALPAPTRSGPGRRVWKIMGPESTIYTGWRHTIVFSWTSGLDKAANW